MLSKSGCGLYKDSCCSHSCCSLTEICWYRYEVYIFLRVRVKYNGAPPLVATGKEHRVPRCAAIQRQHRLGISSA